MKFQAYAAASVLALLSPVAALAQAATAPASPPAAAVAPFPDALKTPQAQVGYVLGLNLGTQMKKDGVVADPDFMAKGLKDAFSGAKPLLDDAQVRQVLLQLQQQMIAQRQEAAAKASAGNRAQGQTFLAANKTKPGVVTLPDGLQYQILKAGTGPKPKLTDTVECNYRGTLIDGTEFDSSYSRNAPETFPVNGVIKGWTEALQLMPVGSKWRLFLPADLAYGDKGAGDKIGPGSVLIFDVELLSIKPS